MAISVKTEGIDITLNFDNGDSGTFYCYPNQNGFFEKLSSLGQRIENKLKEIDMSNIEINSKGEVEIEENISAEQLEDIKAKISILERASDVFKEEVDEVLGDGASDVIFRYNSPLSLHSGYGTFYAVGILGDISKEIMEKLKTTQAKSINKHFERK